MDASDWDERRDTQLARQTNYRTVIKMKNRNDKSAYAAHGVTRDSLLRVITLLLRTSYSLQPYFRRSRSGWHLHCTFPLRLAKRTRELKGEIIKMVLQVSPEKQTLENEIQLSYFVKRKGGKPPHVGVARLLDISGAGLCMEISLAGSELFMELQGSLFLLNKNVEMQIFCRSHPNNISIEGCIKWFRQNDEAGDSADGDKVCVGVIFLFEDPDQRKELAELVELLKNDMVRCSQCGAVVCTDAPLCYTCGARLVPKRAFFKKLIGGLLNGNESAEVK
ncbi:MAG: hypothetical protein JSV16_10265 [Candidatus Hydrogenedentota bacterium]|nr:MAG: hypothetical protein JSV16_10265 [Candidatus Hydrogenedentota bacterium]